MCFLVVEVPHEVRADEVEPLVQRVASGPTVAAAGDDRDRMCFELVRELRDLRVLPEDWEPNIVQGRRSLLRIHRASLAHVQSSGVCIGPSPDDVPPPDPPPDDAAE